MDSGNPAVYPTYSGAAQLQAANVTYPRTDDVDGQPDGFAEHVGVKPDVGQAASCNANALFSDGCFAE